MLTKHLTCTLSRQCRNYIRAAQEASYNSVKKWQKAMAGSNEKQLQSAVLGSVRPPRPLKQHKSNAIDVNLSNISNSHIYLGPELIKAAIAAKSSYQQPFQIVIHLQRLQFINFLFTRQYNVAPNVFLTLKNAFKASTLSPYKIRNLLNSWFKNHQVSASTYIALHHFATTFLKDKAKYEGILRKSEQINHQSPHISSIPSIRPSQASNKYDISAILRSTNVAVQRYLHQYRVPSLNNYLIRCFNQQYTLLESITTMMITITARRE
ncbi:hypothetical protein F4679DRAFT_260938 [Xylaria curta]|nr:hypothetical protein F4679DRAFT_260938 [Xylaria curta]